MSADKRKTILITFAGLAVVLVAVIFIVSPSFKSEDATGAIGAVQKHRAPQIAKADVILGSEQQRHQQNVLYGDYLKDAATLQSFAIGVKSADAKASDGIRASIDAKQQDIGLRFASDVTDALAAIKNLAESDDAALRAKKAAILSEAESIGVRTRDKALDANEMNQIGVRLRDLVEAVGVKQQDIEAVAMKKNENESVDGIRGTLGALDRSALGLKLQGESDYAVALADEAAVLADAEDKLATRVQESADAVSARCRNEADKLEALAVGNMKSAYARDNEAIMELGRMSQALARTQGNADAVGLKNELDQKATDARSQATNDMAFQMDAMGTRIQAAQTLGVRINHQIVDYLGTMAQAKASASAAPDNFAMQAQSLLGQARDLESRKNK